MNKYADNMEQIIEEIEVDDLTEDSKLLLKVMDVKQLIELSKEVGGSDIYVPTLSNLMIKPRNRQIRKKFNGKNHRQLAKEYGMTVVNIMNIVKK